MSSPMALAPCSSCGRVLQVRRDGNVRIHGPVKNRCPGSSLPATAPTTITTIASSSTSSGAASSHPSSDGQPQVPPDASAINPGTINCRILKRIPRGSRAPCAQKLSSILDKIVQDNSRESAWDRLFRFARRCLAQPKRGGHRRSLATSVNQAIEHEQEASTSSCPSRGSSLAKKVSAKLEDGDFKGAVRLVSSTEPVCKANADSLKLLQEKHPPPDPHSEFPLPHTQSPPPVMTTTDVAQAVLSFPTGSAGGPDGLKPQHLTDLVTHSLSKGPDGFLVSLTEFINLVIQGKVPLCARPFFFGATLTGLSKKDGGVRPIAVGCVMRRLAAKCLCNSVFEKMGSLLFPHQLGFGTALGAEAAVHAARSYLSNLQDSHLIIKLDFRNAFNSIRRDLMLHSVLTKAPELLPLAYCSYRHPSLLFFGGFTIPSAEGVQQGDPLGPLLFCLSIHEIITNLKSEFNVFYLDDGVLGGPVEDVKSDVMKLEKAANEIGLSLNHDKSEIICIDDASKSSMLSLSGSFRIVEPAEATLLGSPIGGDESLDLVWRSKLNQLETLGSRLEQLQAHDAICLLKNALAIPKVLYVLRTSPSFTSSLLGAFDGVLRALLESICNIRLSDLGWIQASLPVNIGGLGIRSVTTLAPSAFLASAAGTSSIALALLPPTFPSLPCPHRAEALRLWKSSSSLADEPTGSSAGTQKAWDGPVVSALASNLLSSAADPITRARLLASQQKESGAWLSAPPISAVGLRMDNDTIRVAVGLCLGSALCHPHDCAHCGASVSERGIHALSCRKSQGRLPRHAHLNDIVKRAMISADIPCSLEPRGLCRGDGRRPDGMSIIPWKQGRCLIWNATCHDTFAPTNIPFSCNGAGIVADRAAASKRILYSDLCQSHIFVPIAIESSGSFGKDALDFLHDLSRRIRQKSKDPQSYLKLCQKISVCIQRFNSVSVLGCSSTS